VYKFVGILCTAVPIAETPQLRPYPLSPTLYLSSNPEKTNLASPPHDQLCVPDKFGAFLVRQTENSLPVHCPQVVHLNATEGYYQRKGIVRPFGRRVESRLIRSGLHDKLERRQFF
jgi:hypothetical protein